LHLCAPLDLVFDSTGSSYRYGTPRWFFFVAERAPVIYLYVQVLSAARIIFCFLSGTLLKASGFSQCAQSLPRSVCSFCVLPTSARARVSFRICSPSVHARAFLQGLLGFVKPPASTQFVHTGVTMRFWSAVQKATILLQISAGFV
jgi:hypothetical protein